MKRTAPSPSSTSTTPKAKKPRPQVPAYHLTPSRTDESGEVIWPAPREQIEEARSMILECAKANSRTIIVPDKDADGLTSGSILYRTLVSLGLSPALITAHMLQKGTTVHDAVEREKMSAAEPSYIFVLDQGSRKAPRLIDEPHKGMVIDHHFAASGDDFPAGAKHVTACDSPPVATSSLLTYHICQPLHPDVQAQSDWLCAMGTHGDLGNTIKWEPPFPDMKDMFKRYTKKAINDAVSLINAPRRTPSFNVLDAWTALNRASDPAALLKDKALLAARAAVNDEVDKWARTPPKFSKDGTIAVFRISSGAQIHPVIATRWAGHLSSAKLEIVLVANSGYLPDMVNFSCRVARCARSRDPPVSIIQSLKAIAEASPSGTLRERLGESFARGHNEASGGIVPVAEFEELMGILRVGEKAEKAEGKSPKKAKVIDAKQSNTLTNYFGKKTEAEETA
ncbi:DHH family protein [Saccharata proteae CBS 121410]|uniref:DHH family protein n=1 Tax=Saccharata proteae CBS 121410 TaxID=1314787 RepID=A0A9P4HNN2_9PEZI|nr:DHH family protein [Saccharata proteae CBS 121410]